MISSSFLSRTFPIRSNSYWYGHQLPQVCFSINLMFVSLINFWFLDFFIFVWDTCILDIVVSFETSNKSCNVTFIFIYDIFQYWILLSVRLYINASLFFPLMLANFPLTLYSKSVCISILMFVTFIFIVYYLYDLVCDFTDYNNILLDIFRSYMNLPLYVE